DVNNDGMPDVLIVGPGIEGSQIYLNAANGTFTPGSTLVESGPFNIVLAGALGDVNGDGCVDAVIADGNGYVWVLPGDCAGNFPQSSYVPMGDSNASVAVADVNGDGKTDVLLLDEGYNGEYFITSFLNDGTGRFAAPLASDAGVSLPSQWMGDYRLGDFRNTGHLDFVGIGLGLSYSTGTQYI